MTDHRIFQPANFGWKLTARVFVTTWFVIGGIAHLIHPEPFLRIMPPYIPYHLACVYISGAFELMGAAGLWIKPLRSLAGYGLMALTAIVTVANVHMYQHPELFPNIPEWLLLARFPVQIALIWLIWWCSRPYKASAHVNIQLPVT
ncbi:MAG: DoxX family protein [Pseudomonadota bacterium]